jgi:RNA polymerase sigma-70 factor (ECF subfamily)
LSGAIGNKHPFSGLFKVEGPEMVDQRPTADIGLLVTEHHEAVFRYAYRLTGSVPDAEDLTQQVFLAAQLKLGQLRNIDSVRSWLFTILRNFFLKSCQKRVPTPAGNLRMNIDAIPDTPPSGEDIDRERLQVALSQLPPNYRVVLVMFYFEGCSYRQIAEQLDLPIGTVMSRLARAKGHLRAKLFEPDSRSASPTRPSAAKQGG